MRVLYRAPDSGIQRILQYDDLRVADAPAGSETTSIIWDQVKP